MSANMESGAPTQEQPPPVSTICTVRHSGALDACHGTATENTQGDDQNLQELSMVRKADGGGIKCAVAWETLFRPKWVGGLGVTNLRWMNMALQAKWLWLQRADQSRPWAKYKFSVPNEMRGLFQVAARVSLGDGRTSLFWEDQWLHGYRLQELAP